MVTMVVPRKRLMGMFLFGLITSPAVKVMLFQASEENREPTMATPIAAMIAKPVSGTGPDPFTCCCGSQKIRRFSWIAFELEAKISPIRIKRSSRRNFPLPRRAKIV